LHIVGSSAVDHFRSLFIGRKTKASIAFGVRKASGSPGTSPRRDVDLSLNSDGSAVPLDLFKHDQPGRAATLPARSPSTTP
jgi:hypothetical protein